MMKNIIITLMVALIIGIVLTSGCIDGEEKPSETVTTEAPTTTVPVPELIRVEDDDPAFVYSGYWRLDENPGVSGGSCMITGYGIPSYEPIKVDIKFNGTGVSLLHAILPEGGIAEITIDGMDYPSIDMYAPSFGLKKTTIAMDLTNSEHTLTITPSENHNPAVPPLPIEEGGADRPIIIIDAIEVTVPQ